MSPPVEYFVAKGDPGIALSAPVLAFKANASITPENVPPALPLLKV
jgi:hypothetical protein